MKCSSDSAAPAEGLAGKIAALSVLPVVLVANVLLLAVVKRVGFLGYSLLTIRAIVVLCHDMGMQVVAG